MFSLPAFFTRATRQDSKTIDFAQKGECSYVESPYKMSGAAIEINAALSRVIVAICVDLLLILVER